MPPRRRAATDPEDGSYDGVPTVNVVLDSEPAADAGEPELPLDVVKVPALEGEPAGDGEA